MNNRTSTILTALIGVICGLFIICLFFFPQIRTVHYDVVQGILIGGGLAFITAQIYARIKATKVNGWITVFGCGVPGKSMLFRTACAQIFPGPVNVPQEAMYWTTSGDGAGHTLSGDAAVLTGYMGMSTSFEEALADFSVAYADQNERDHAALLEAIHAGRVEADMEH